MANAWRSAKTLAGRTLMVGGVLGIAVLIAAVVVTTRSDAQAPAATASASARAAMTSGADAPLPAAHPQAVEPEAGVAAADQPASTSKTTTSTAGPSDDEIKRELSQLKSLASKADLPVGDTGRVLPDGRAVAPRGAPQIVRDVINAGNVIAKTPYLWGGGHGSWSSVGYDCSGSVSFALAGAGLLDSPLTSGLLAKWGAAGPGHWITIYANAGHVFMFVAGLRFDTGGLGGNGTRWQPTLRGTAGFVARHPEGL
jgi:cell wall-associated NlpC family hydrolase